MSETIKAFTRREREGFFDKYCVGHGLDIGCGTDTISHPTKNLSVEGYDLILGHKDAHTLPELKNKTYDWVYSSHCLEHMQRPHVALSTWWSKLRVGGYLIIQVPERDLYEKQLTKPSRWNGDHKFYYILHRDELPATLGLVPLVAKSCVGARILEARTLMEEPEPANPLVHSGGEYSIELIAKKIR